MRNVRPHLQPLRQQVQACVRLLVVLLLRQVTVTAGRDEGGQRARGLVPQADGGGDTTGDPSSTAPAAQQKHADKVYALLMRPGVTAGTRGHAHTMRRSSLYQRRPNACPCGSASPGLLQDARAWLLTCTVPSNAAMLATPLRRPAALAVCVWDTHPFARQIRRRLAHQTG